MSEGERSRLEDQRRFSTAIALPTLGTAEIFTLEIAAAYPYLDQWWAWLSPDEQARADRLFRSADRDRFIVSRGGLRLLLSRYLACAPDALTLTYGPQGKPSLLHPALEFNLAHSGDWVVYGVSRDRAIGVDVEQILPRRHLDGLEQRCLTPCERATLSPEPTERLRQFLAYWTVKEAHLKAIGQGLSYPMQRVEVGWQPEPHLRIPAIAPNLAVSAWTVATWEVAEDAIAAVCVAAVPCTLRYQPFPLITAPDRT